MAEPNDSADAAFSVRSIKGNFEGNEGLGIFRASSVRLNMS